MDPHDRARALRQESSDAEALLWSHLRARRLQGFKFRRQHPIGPFITDFACIEAALVVEVDGDHHAQQRERDQARTRYLESHGYTVIRFWNHDVLQHTDAVLDAICDRIRPSPLPSPRKRGEGA